MSDKKSTFEQFEVAGDKLVETVKNLIHEGNVRRIILKREDGSALLEIPVNAGLVGLALTVAIAPVLLAIGAIAAVVRRGRLAGHAGRRTASGCGGFGRRTGNAPGRRPRRRISRPGPGGIHLTLGPRKRLPSLSNGVSPRRGFPGARRTTTRGRRPGRS
ncbi:DUF4342 domain-containing protein [Agreia sp. Leaf210]|uniref:DUF4342 domain-containing protein n=1 Tax=Agreia sp. Leaf210 TaxID=1735682 RepID=UPI0009EA294B|nr:DUF4342 domain-containing protein [Agreia sp. Leaf210]